MFLPLLNLVVPWFLVGLVSSSSRQQKQQGDDSSSSSVTDRYLKPFSLELHNFPQTGRGVRTVVDRAPGDILLQVPVADTVVATDEESSFVSSTSDTPSTTTTTTLSNEQKLAMKIALLRKEHHPYISSDMIPKVQHFSVWSLPSELWDLLCLPKCYRESFQATRTMVTEFCRQQSFSDNNKNNNGDDDDIDTIEWAFSMTRSRSIAVPELTQENAVDKDPVPLALIPGLDLFNHGFDAGTVLQLKDNTWTLTSSKSYNAGDQIFLSYGDDKDNWKLLLTYGFSIPNNPNTLVFWTWEELLQAAGQVRPKMFPERVRQSLFRHPQLTIYTTPTEDRATFSFDAKTQTPRESLQNGLTLLSSLATQLGYPQDDELPQEVMEQLVQNRLIEIQNCRGKLSSSSKSVPSEWKTFWGSVQLALEEEEAYLSNSSLSEPASTGEEL